MEDEPKKLCNPSAKPPADMPCTLLLLRPPSPHALLQPEVETVSRRPVVMLSVLGMGWNAPDVAAPCLAPERRDFRQEQVVNIRFSTKTLNTLQQQNLVDDALYALGTPICFFTAKNNLAANLLVYGRVGVRHPRKFELAKHRVAGVLHAEKLTRLDFDNEGTRFARPCTLTPGTNGT